MSPQSLPPLRAKSGGAPDRALSQQTPSYPHRLARFHERPVLQKGRLAACKASRSSAVTHLAELVGWSALDPFARDVQYQAP
jgi:hypothetical protein